MGVPSETLLAFSGHIQLEALLRYLDFGAKPSERTHAQDAARRHRSTFERGPLHV